MVEIVHVDRSRVLLAVFDDPNNPFKVVNMTVAMNQIYARILAEHYYHRTSGLSSKWVHCCNDGNGASRIPVVFEPTKFGLVAVPRHQPLIVSSPETAQIQPPPTRRSSTMNFFKTKPRTPPDLVRGLRDAIPKLESGVPGGETRRKASEDISKNLQQIKAILFGDGEPVPELVAQLAQETYNTDLLYHIVLHISRFDFESRKDVVQIFNNLLRRQIGSRWPTVEYLCGKHEVIFATLAGYENEDVALNTGMILKEMLKHESLCKILLYSDKFYTFPHYIETTTFGISCDAFANLKETLTRHKPMVADYIDKNYDRFFSSFTTLILSNNYVTKRQSLKLLGEILLDRANFNVMTRYIANEANLKMMMNLLRDKSKNIQFEAFHVFKVFVANPKKPPQIEAILRRNKEKLLVFLKNFHNDKEDEQFSDEKQFLIVQIQGL